jgi:hypothetical protein
MTYLMIRGVEGYDASVCNCPRGVLFVLAPAAVAYASVVCSTYFDLTVPGGGGVAFTNTELTATMAPNYCLNYHGVSGNTENFSLANGNGVVIGGWTAESAPMAGCTKLSNGGDQNGEQVRLAVGSPWYKIGNSTAYGYWQP